MRYLLAIDQGTTTSRAIVFTANCSLVASHQVEFKQYFPADGWVEHDGEEIWQTILTCCKKALEKAKLNASDITAIGISNQRETCLVWNKKTGELLHPAIVWQDRRTAFHCQQLIKQGMQKSITDKTGLLLDPYFSATKIAWLLNNVPEIKKFSQKNELAFGTIDTFLLWRLTGGKSFFTDATNASRTMLYNIHHQCWDKSLLTLFNIPENILPEVKNNSDYFGETESKLFGVSIPITGMAGDQQAAAIGQACFSKGMVKSTYGTGCFVLLNTGDKALSSNHSLLTTIAYQINQKVTYGLEGSIFVAGAAVQWLRDALHLIYNADETGDLARSTKDDHGVYLVPAFTGLGAPYWDPLARGAIFGLTRDTGVKQIVRACLEAVCYQTRDLIEAMKQDGIESIQELRVDGGMVVNNWLMQFLADMLNTRVNRAKINETSALGAAFLAGLHSGIYSSLNEITSLWQSDEIFDVKMEATQRTIYYQGWLDAVSRVRKT